MKIRSSLSSSRGFTLLDLAIILSLLIVVAAILFPVFARPHRGHGRKYHCQSNLKELSMTLHLYLDDYNGVLPSSILRLPKGSTTWNALESARFCSQRGQIPPESNPSPQEISWVSSLWLHMKNKDIIWCLSDYNKVPDTADYNDLKHKHAMVSYIYKPAVDRAWFGLNDSSRKAVTYRKLDDFDFASDQIFLFEHSSWHWGEQKKGWSDQVRLNAVFLDGHVRVCRLKDAVGCPTPKDAKELAEVMSRGGEPLWFNTYQPDDNTKISGKEVWFDPRVCFDDLP